MKNYHSQRNMLEISVILDKGINVIRKVESYGSEQWDISGGGNVPLFFVKLCDNL